MNKQKNAFEPYAELRGEPEVAAVPPLVVYWNTIRRRKWLIAAITAATVLAGTILTLLATPLYQATSRLQIEREGQRITEVKEVDEIDTGDSEEFYQTQYALLRARSLAERVARELNLPSDEAFFETFGREPAGSAGAVAGADLRSARVRQAASILLENVNILPIRSSSLVDIQVTSPDPALSAKISNAWAEQFIAETLERRFAATRDARSFLEKRLAELRDRLETSERELVNYAASEGIINLSQGETATGLSQPDRTVTSVDLEALNTALAEATTARISAESALRSQQPGRQTSDTLGNLRQARAEAAAELAQLGARFGPEYPEVQAARSQVASLDRAIAEENTRVSANYRQQFDESVARERALQQRVNALKNNLVGEQAASIQYNIYQREVDTNRQLYDVFLQRFKEIGVAGVASNNVFIVDQALVPTKPASPNLPLNLLLALLLGIFLALLVVISLEQIDQKLKDPTDVTARLGLPLLGVIPKVDEDELDEAMVDAKSDIAEAFLSLQTNLSFLTDHGVPRSLLFTSTRPNEGKSSSTVALARSFARTGKRVLLIDADMRNSSSHKLLNTTNEHGLSNYLAGEEFTQDLLTPTMVPNLSLMAAGPKPPNAGELLLSPRLGRLVREASEQFDVVLIDAPPVLGIADVPLVARVAEGVVYTIEMDGARVRQVQQSLDRIIAGRAHLFGALVTKYDHRGSAYGYGYGYGYGRDNEMPAAAS